MCQDSSRFIHADSVLGGDTGANKVKSCSLELKFQQEENQLSSVADGDKCKNKSIVKWERACQGSISFRFSGKASQ